MSLRRLQETLKKCDRLKRRNPKPEDAELDEEGEGFDGTLSDLGTTPTAAMSVVDARGGSSKLAGYAGIPKKSKRHKKHRKHEDIDRDCFGISHGESPKEGLMVGGKHTDNTNKRARFNQDDEIEVTRGSNKGVNGIAKSSDVDLRDEEDEFQGKPVQQANIKPDIKDVDQYHIIDDKEKVSKRKK